MSFESRLYELDNSFDRRALQNPDARRKLQLFKALVPRGCLSILDVGGGTGWLTLGLREKCQVVTLDRSLSSMVKGIGCKVQGDASYLPFPDRSFDLVLSSQVLEHLPGAIFDKTRSEMARVAKKFLIVSVPYRENLLARMVKCIYCGEVFHTDHHVRAFNEQNMATLINGWYLAEWHVFGVLKKAAGIANISDIPKHYNKRDVPPASEYTVCPSCGMQGGTIGKLAAPSSKRKGGFQRLITIVRKQISKHKRLVHSSQYSPFLPQKKAPYFIASLYFPDESVSEIDGDIFDILRSRSANEKAPRDFV